MTDPILELRAAVNELLAQPDPAEDSDSDAKSDSLDRAMVAFFASEPPSSTFAAVLVELAAGDIDVAVRPGRAAALAAAPQPARAISVEEALRLPTGVARAALQRALALNSDAADEFLERPAAALARRSPGQIRHLAALARRPLPELYRAIADSWRSNAGFAYAYRPAVQTDLPAEVPEGTGLGPLIDWGIELLSPDSAETA